MGKQTPSTEHQSPGTISGSKRREWWSLALFLHLFCVTVALFAPESNSEIAIRLRRLLGPYLRLINLDTQTVAGFQLTHAMEYEDNHQIVVRVDGDESAEVWPRPTSGFSFDGLRFRQHRWLNLTQQIAMFVSTEDDEALAELARAIGSSILRDTGSRRLEFRCQRLPPLELSTPDPVGEPETIYRADIWVDSNGLVRVHKRVPTSESAPVVVPPSRAQQTTTSSDTP